MVGGSYIYYVYQLHKRCTILKQFIYVPSIVTLQECGINMKCVASSHLARISYISQKYSLVFVQVSKYMSTTLSIMLRKILYREEEVS